LDGSLDEAVHVSRCSVQHWDVVEIMLFPAFMLCSATADFSGWSSRMRLMCSLRVVSMDLPVWPMYTFPHSQGIRYTPGIFRPKSSLAVLSNCLFFYIGMWTVLILYFVKSLLILLDTACWYGSTEVSSTWFRVVSF
jgi:hypothetical protein